MSFCAYLNFTVVAPTCSCDGIVMTLCALFVHRMAKNYFPDLMWIVKINFDGFMSIQLRIRNNRLLNGRSYHWRRAGHLENEFHRDTNLQSHGCSKATNYNYVNASIKNAQSLLVTLANFTSKAVKWYVFQKFTFFKLQAFQAIPNIAFLHLMHSHRTWLQWITAPYLCWGKTCWKVRLI